MDLCKRNDCHVEALCRRAAGLVLMGIVALVFLDPLWRYVTIISVLVFLAASWRYGKPEPRKFERGTPTWQKP